MLSGEKPKCRGCLLSAVLLFIQQFREGRGGWGGEGIDPLYKACQACMPKDEL